MVGNVSSELEETTVGAVSYSLGNQTIVNPLPSSNITYVVRVMDRLVQKMSQLEESISHGNFNGPKATSSPSYHQQARYQEATNAVICFHWALCQRVYSQHVRKTSNPLAIGQAGEGDSDMTNSIIDLFAINPHAAFYINSVINSYMVHFMSDTEAAVSLLNTNTWN